MAPFPAHVSSPLLARHVEYKPVGRNHLLIGAGTVVVIALVALLGSLLTGDDDEGVDTDTSPLAPSPRLAGTVGNASIGATIRKPRRWSHRSGGHSLTLRSPDGAVVMAVSLPSGTDRSAAVLQTGVMAIRQQYRQVRVLGRLGQRVADLPTISIVTSATNARGVRLRILTSAPQGRTRAWLVQVFSAVRAKERRLAEAQVAIASLRLTG